MSIRARERAVIMLLSEPRDGVAFIRREYSENGTTSGSVIFLT